MVLFHKSVDHFGAPRKILDTGRLAALCPDFFVQFSIDPKATLVLPVDSFPVDFFYGAFPSFKNAAGKKEIPTGFIPVKGNLFFPHL